MCVGLVFVVDNSKTRKCRRIRSRWSDCMHPIEIRWTGFHKLFVRLYCQNRDKRLEYQSCFWQGSLSVCWIRWNKCQRWTPLLIPRDAIFNLVFGEVCSVVFFVVFLSPQCIWKERATGPTPWPLPPPVCRGLLSTANGGLISSPGFVKLVGDAGGRPT